MELRLTDMTILVSGAGSSGPGVGIGKAIAATFARAGAKILLVDIDADAADETKRMIDESGGEASCCIADLRNPDNCARAVEDAISRYGQLHGIVNNLALTRPARSVAETDIQHWHDIIDVSLTAATMLASHAAPRMADGGTIINIGSTASERGFPGHNAAYTAAKGGLASLTRLWAVELGRRQIRVNCILPGTVKTPMAAGAVELSERELRWRSHMVPLGIPGTAWDVASAALFLASPQARWITGALLPVDGGTLAASPYWGAEAASSFDG